MDVKFQGGYRVAYLLYLLSHATHQSIDLSSRLCDAMQAAESSCEGARDCVFSNYPGGIFPVCNATGSGLKLPLGNGLNMTLWTTTESWNLVKVNGQSIRDVISLFVTSALGSSSSSSSTLLIDPCPGPNCVPQDSTEENPAQSLIEMDNVFTPISIWLRILVTIILSSMPLFFLLTVCGCGIGGGKQTQTDNKSQVPEQTRSKPCRTSLYLNGLSVFSSSGDKILDDVSVDFKCSTLNCLLGKSGSGKSCFLGVLSRQLRSNLQVQYKNGTDLSRMSCTYMRQQDFGMKNMTPNEYLSTTARVYGTCKDRLDFILDLVRPFFPVKTETSENGETIVSLDPFNNVPLKELSGGQRRMISIATALFQESRVLLLDEPLSGIDSASTEKIIDLLKNIAKDKSMIVLMTLHQPSDDILLKMDTVMVLGNGRVLFASDSQTGQGMRSSVSTSNFIHSIISEQTVYERLSSSVFDNSISIESEGGDSESVGTRTSFQGNDSFYWSRLRLWQVWPLLRRLHLECPPGLQDVILLPVCYLAMSVWGSFDSSPLQRYLITACLTIIPSVLFQTRLIINWGLLECHIWDLEDKRISPLSYLIASGIHMFYLPIVSVAVSFSIVYASFGWKFDSFWDVILFSIMLTVSNLQFGKMLSAAMQTYQAVVGFYSAYSYLSLVVSGSFINPVKIPSYLHWIMYMSLSFWGVSGVQLSQLEHSDIGNKNCLTLISCIAYNPNFIASLTGYTVLTTAQKSMSTLCFAAILLVMIEYCLLLKKVSQRGNYKRVEGEGEGASNLQL